MGLIASKEERNARAEQKRADLRELHGRTPRETREQVLVMLKTTNKKYARPFEADRLSHVSVMGGNWEEYAAIVVQMAILDTLLSIEEKLDQLNAEPGG